MRILITPRLTGLPAGRDDYSFLRSLHGDRRVAATLSADGRVPAATTQRFLRRMLREAGPGAGLWIFRQEGRPVGYCGLRRVVIGGAAETELLYAAAADDWNRGLATEMARAVLEAGFTEAGLGDMVAFTLPLNRASRRIMEKCGFAFERDFIHAGLPHVLYRLRRR
ncbi:MAG: GNAT family N-acetyltransferase [Rhodospirillales bacterium]|nr:GNAT family N-acetyltransferase [Rhodospirillales bacterium]